VKFVAKNQLLLSVPQLDKIFAEFSYRCAGFFVLLGGSAVLVELKRPNKGINLFSPSGGSLEPRRVPILDAFESFQPREYELRQGGVEVP